MSLAADDLPAPLRFGRFELQPLERRLLSDGAAVAVGARAFDMLWLLASNAGRLVTKDELLDGVWRGLVVEENNLQVQVSTLRKLLGAQSIATIPGHGYRFTLPVVRPLVAEGAAGSAVAPVTAAAPAAAPATSPMPIDERLPQRLPPLHGREADLTALSDRCGHEPLVTLVGPGGVGKTRLAQEMARRIAGRGMAVVWVELASLDDGALLPARVATAVGLDRADDLIAALRPLELLIVLDNAEHLLDAVAAFAQTVRQATRGVRLLVTSQAPLRVDGEVVWRLEGLARAPDEADVDQALSHGAVALFCERVQSLDRRFSLRADNLAAVLEICRRLDGVPLALQLAAARAASLGAAAVAERLDARFALLKSGARDAAARHGSLHAALDWSHDLLTPVEQAVFRRLGVFAGDFGLDAAADVAVAVAVAGAPLDRWDAIDGLAALVDRSLVEVRATEPPRYALAETARAYALERLAGAGESEAVRDAHAATVRRGLEPASDDWLRMTDRDWLTVYAVEIDNLRAALARVHERLVAAPGDADAAETMVALFGATAPLWHHLALDGEARRWAALTAAALSGPAASTLPAVLAARAWRGIQWAWAAAEPGRSRAAASEAARLYRELGDVHGQFAQLTGEAGLYAGPDPRARKALEAALALERADWPARERAWGQRARADVARAEGRFADSRAAREAELALRTEAGDERGRLRALAHLADVALALGDADDAVRRGRQLLAEPALQRPSSTRCTALLNLIHALLVQGEVDAAVRWADEAARVAADFGLLWLAADHLAWIAALQGRADAAVVLTSWADAAHAERGEQRPPARAEARARVRALLGPAHDRGPLDGPVTATAARSEVDIAALWRARP